MLTAFPREQKKKIYCSFLRIKPSNLYMFCSYNGIITVDNVDESGYYVVYNTPRCGIAENTLHINILRLIK